jgi:hypothetical protein
VRLTSTCDDSEILTYENSKMSQEVIDISLPSQIASIESSFARSHPPSGFNLSTIKHPGNPKLTAVESWEVFPDEDVWANTYDLFKFAERPGDRGAEVRSISFAFEKRKGANNECRKMTLVWTVRSLDPGRKMAKPSLLIIL